jgi:RimJ/RimL family protein N-acetyltransferase
MRRLEVEDLPARVAWFNTPSVYEKMPLDVPFSLADTTQWLFKNALNRTRYDFVFLLRDHNAEEMRAAMGGLVNFDARHRRAELYVVVEPTMTGGGIGRKAVQCLCNYGFVHLNLFRIYLYTLSSNQGAKRFYERLGFVQEGILRGHHYHHGAFVDRHLYGMLRDEWEVQPWSVQGPVEFIVPLES